MKTNSKNAIPSGLQTTGSLVPADNQQAPQHTKGELTTNSYALMSTDISKQYFCEIKIGKRLIAQSYGKTVEEAEANAQRIVTAVNEYDSLKAKEVLNNELVQMLSEVCDAYQRFRDSDLLETPSNAITKARALLLKVTK